MTSSTSNYRHLDALLTICLGGQLRGVLFGTVQFSFAAWDARRIL